MGWEDIIKRPFDVSRELDETLEERTGRNPDGDDVGRAELKKAQSLKKYLDRYFKSSLRGGSRVFSTERRYYDKGVAGSPNRPYNEKVLNRRDYEGSFSNHGEDRSISSFTTNVKRYPKSVKVKDIFEVAIPVQDWNEFPNFVKKFIEDLEPHYIEKRYNIEVVTIGEKNNFGYVLRYRKR